jgi:putative hydrolase of the HAD superfamily
VSPAAPVRAVLWDFGGILYPTPYEVAAEVEVLRGFPAESLPRGPFTPGGDQAYDAVDAGAVREPDYWAAKHAVLAAGGIDFVATRDIDWTGRERPSTIVLMREIHAAGLKQGALTNDSTAFLGAGWQERFVLRNSFDVICDSVDIGVRKPAPDSFRIALEHLGSAAAETVFVDDLSVNVRAAAAVGLQVWHFDVTDAIGTTVGLRAMIGL